MSKELYVESDFWKHKPVISIDITRLLDRELQGRLPTGVDRVSLEYIRHFFDHSRAMVRFAGRWLTLSKDNSKILFDELLNPSVKFRNTVYAYVFKSYISNWEVLRHYMLFNTGHSGLDRADYLFHLQKREIQPITNTLCGDRAISCAVKLQPNWNTD